MNRPAARDAIRPYKAASGLPAWKAKAKASKPNKRKDRTRTVQRVLMFWVGLG